jgi:hypothetical protein
VEAAMARIVPPSATEPEAVVAYPRLWQQEGVTEQQVGARRALDAASLWRLHVAGGAKRTGGGVA